MFIQPIGLAFSSAQPTSGNEGATKKKRRTRPSLAATARQIESAKAKLSTKESELALRALGQLRKLVNIITIGQPFDSNPTNKPTEGFHRRTFRLEQPNDTDKPVWRYASIEIHPSDEIGKISRVHIENLKLKPSKNRREPDTWIHGRNVYEIQFDEKGHPQKLLLEMMPSQAEIKKAKRAKGLATPPIVLQEIPNLPLQLKALDIAPLRVIFSGFPEQMNRLHQHLLSQLPPAVIKIAKKPATTTKKVSTTAKPG